MQSVRVTETQHAHGMSKDGDVATTHSSAELLPEWQVGVRTWRNQRRATMKAMAGTVTVITTARAVQPLSAVWSTLVRSAFTHQVCCSPAPSRHWALFRAELVPGQGVRPVMSVAGVSNSSKVTGLHQSVWHRGDRVDHQ